MFPISKLIEFVLLPSNLIGLLGAVGLIGLVIGRRRFGGAVLAVATVLLLLAGWSPLGPGALKILEDRFPRPDVDGPVAGIIMLGGAVNTHITADRGTAALNDAGERVVATAMLSRQFPDSRILLSGGARDIANAESASESAIARNLLVAMGVPAERIELEERSRTTCENAEQSILVAGPEPGEQWLLVTSASHMPRAVACFRAAGFPVTPFPTDYRTRGVADLRRPVASIGDGLQMLDLAAHEWLGLVTYRLLGRTAELFPSQGQ